MERRTALLTLATVLAAPLVLGAAGLPWNLAGRRRLAVTAPDRSVKRHG